MADCSKFYLCIIGNARQQGCGPGLVFNPETLSCEKQSTVTGPCSSFYNQTFLESLSTPPPKPNPAFTAGMEHKLCFYEIYSYFSPGRVISQAAQDSRRRPSRPQTGSRRPVGQSSLQPQEQQRPQEIIPQQLLDLQDFGQTGEDLKKDPT